MIFVSEASAGRYDTKRTILQNTARYISAHTLTHTYTHTHAHTHIHTHTYTHTHTHTHTDRERKRKEGERVTHHSRESILEHHFISEHFGTHFG